MSYLDQLDEKTFSSDALRGIHRARGLAQAGCWTCVSMAMVVADILSVVLVIIAAAAVVPDFVPNVTQTFLLAGMMVGIFAYGGLYNRSGWELGETRGVVLGIGVLGLIHMALHGAGYVPATSVWFFVAYPAIVLLAIALRMVVRGLPIISGMMTTHVLLFGSKDLADRLHAQAKNSRAGVFNVVDSLPFDKVIGEDPLRIEQTIRWIAAKNRISAHQITVVLAPELNEVEAAEALRTDLSMVERPVTIMLPFAGLARNGVRLRASIGADMVMAEVESFAPSTLTYWIKRIADLMLGVVAIVVFSPVFIIVGAILAAEGGPIFYRQTRVGYLKRRFTCLKFRSMRVDAQEVLEEVLARDPAAREEWRKYQKLKNDPRVTRIGDFLRKTSLDELPQLFNVLRGDMSLVGPRPIVAPEVDGYPADKAYFENPDFSDYARCKPGITGLWQVLGRASTSHNERVRLDRWYSRNTSFWLDLLILFKTVHVVLNRKGSV